MARQQMRKCANDQTAESAPDVARERRIARLSKRLEKAMPAERASIWSKMRAEIMSRSPEQVRRMEEARGLQP